MFEHRRKLIACAMLVFGCHAAYRIPEPADKTGGTVRLSGALAFPGAGCGAVAALSAVGTGRIDREPEFGYDHGAGIGRAPRGETALSQNTSHRCAPVASAGLWEAPPAYPMAETAGAACRPGPS